MQGEVLYHEVDLTIVVEMIEATVRQETAEITVTAIGTAIGMILTVDVALLLGIQGEETTTARHATARGHHILGTEAAHLRMYLYLDAAPERYRKCKS